MEVGSTKIHLTLNIFITVVPIALPMPPLPVTVAPII